MSLNSRLTRRYSDQQLRTGNGSNHLFWLAVSSSASGNEGICLCVVSNRRTDCRNSYLGRLLTSLDTVGCSKELEQPDVAELWRDHDVRGITDETRACDSILDERERARKHREHTRLVATAVEEVADEPGPLEFQVRTAGAFIFDIVERVVLKWSLAEGIGIEVDSDCDMGTEGATDEEPDHRSDR